MSVGNGVVLGSREMRLRIDTRENKLLQAMAKRYGRSPTELAEILLTNAISSHAREAAQSQILSVVMGLWL